MCQSETQTPWQTDLFNNRAGKHYNCKHRICKNCRSHCLRLALINIKLEICEDCDAKISPKNKVMMPKAKMEMALISALFVVQ